MLCCLATRHTVIILKCVETLNHYVVYQELTVLHVIYTSKNKQPEKIKKLIEKKVRLVGNRGGGLEVGG